MKKMTDTEIILKQMLDDIKAWKWAEGSTREIELKKLSEFLVSISGEKISQELQLQMVKDFNTCDLIGKIPNITGETLIAYLNSNGINKERIEILFSLYKEKVEPHLKEFLKGEYSKELKIDLLKKIPKQAIIEAKNLECLRLYNQINVTEPVLEPEDEKCIIETNPQYIGEISTPSDELQLFAAQQMSYSIQILSLVENPSTLLYAYILTQYKYDNPNFEGKFENGVTQEIIDEIIKLKPSVAFGNGNYTGHEFTPEEKESIITRYPELFSITKSTDVTPSMILSAIRQLPSNLKHVGQGLNLYSQPILDYTKNVFYKEYKSRCVEEDDNIHAIIAGYQAVIDKRNEVIAEQANTDEKYLSFIKKHKNQ